MNNSPLLKLNILLLFGKTKKFKRSLFLYTRLKSLSNEFNFIQRKNNDEYVIGYIKFLKLKSKTRTLKGKRIEYSLYPNFV